MSSFEYDPEQWWEKYCLHGKCKRSEMTEAGIIPAWCWITHSIDPNCPQVQTSVEMEFGKLVGDRLATDSSYLPHMPRLSHFEYKLECKFGKIKLVGYIDSYEEHIRLFEYKTGKKQWDQKRADLHGQIDFYLLCLWLMHKIRPEKVACSIFWMPTKQNGDFSISFINENEINVLPTVRTMRQVLEFGQRINANYKAMQEYAKNHA